MKTLIGKESELAERQIVEIGHSEVLLLQHEGEWFALAPECVHEGFPLEHAVVKQGAIICPDHGWRFSLRTGEELRGEDGVQPVYPVHVEKGQLFITF